ncbi:MAG: inorganic phosphate transporter [Alphaproteobacteria bacterium]|nr:inorganic phosphate transporter [Alphaproteobacteria bacterium]
MVGTKTVDKDLKRLSRVEKATLQMGRGSVKIGIGFLFVLGVGIYLALQAGTGECQLFVVAAGLIGAYMALNIGANDVANNVGPAVGSAALTLTGALIIAAVFETAGAVLAGSDVVSTIRKGIIDPAGIATAAQFTWAMMAALLSAALWINLATWVGAPVSTTHSIVGGVMGAGIAAAGWSAVNWTTMSKIAASWVISPVLGGLVAAAFLALIKFMIVFKDDKISAAKRWVPILVAIMAAAFSTYLIMKGLKNIWKPGAPMLLAIAAASFFIAWYLVRIWVFKAAEGLENNRKSVGTLFTVPLICSAAMLSFAHGANDVANAVGPLAAIVGSVYSGEVVSKVAVPYWILIVGAIGISAGLVLYGPKLIRTVGSQITKLDRMRAFTVALSASITVIVASALGLPVSSTHIAVGAIFGVGFFREWLVNKHARPAMAVSANNVSSVSVAPADDPLSSEAVDGLGLALPINDKKKAKKEKKRRKKRLVRRSHFLTIIAAWLVTVPLAALLSSLLFFALKGFLSP